jgi:hypothetical protein
MHVDQRVTGHAVVIARAGFRDLQTPTWASARRLSLASTTCAIMQTVKGRKPALSIPKEEELMRSSWILTGLTLAVLCVHPAAADQPAAAPAASSSEAPHCRSIDLTPPEVQARLATLRGFELIGAPEVRELASGRVTSQQFIGHDEKGAAIAYKISCEVECGPGCDRTGCVPRETPSGPTCFPYNCLTAGGFPCSPAGMCRQLSVQTEP